MHEMLLLRRTLLLFCFTFLVFIASWLTYHHRLVALSPPLTGCVNIPALPDYLDNHSTYDAIEAINHARELEHLPSLRLPANFYDLDPVQQQFVLVNVERTDRGLHPLQMDASLSRIALAYSKQLRDLHFFAHTSPISGTFEQRVNSNPALADHYYTAAENLAGNPVAGVGPIYEYMYNDQSEACGHRDNILNPALTLIGIGLVADDQYGSISAQEFIEPAPWNPYHPTMANTVMPRISLTVHDDPHIPLMYFEAHVQDTIGKVRITWFLDHIDDPLQIGANLTLDLRRLPPGKHTLLAYVADGTQHYAVAQETLGP